MEQKIILNVPNGKAKEFEAGLKDLLKECGGKISDIQVKDIFDTSKPIWERIKTVDDAIEYTGMTLPENISELPTDVQAMLKLRIVCAAYNELTADTLNEFPKFTEDEYRYYPWFCLYTQEEIDEMDEDDRSRVLGRSNSYACERGCRLLVRELRRIELDHELRRAALLQEKRIVRRVRKTFH